MASIEPGARHEEPSPSLGGFEDGAFAAHPARRSTSRLYFAALTLLVVFFFWKVLFLGEVAITYNLYREYPWKEIATSEQAARPSMNPDCVQSYYPRRHFATETIRSGEIPLWNPYDFSGAPFLANVQSAVFYPVNVALYAVDPLRAMGIYLFLHFLIAAWGTYLFLRARQLGEFPAFVGAVSVTFCGFLVTRTGHPTFVATAAWVPVVFWRAERLFLGPSLRRALKLGIAHALMVLAGFPQIAFHGSYALGAYALYRAWEAGRTGGPSLRPLAWSLAAMVLSAGLSMVQILPTADFVRFCQGRFLPYETILSSAHHPWCLVKYLVPAFMGDPLHETVWSTVLTRGDGFFSQNYVSTTGYVGILPLLLAWTAVLSRRRGTLFFAGMAAVSLLVVFGTPLLRIAYHLPGFNFSRVDRLVYVYMLAMGILAAIGVSALEKSTASIPRKTLFISLAAFTVAYMALYLVMEVRSEAVYRLIAGGSRPPTTWADAHAGAAFSGILLIAGTGLIGFRLWRRIPSGTFQACIGALLLIDLFSFGFRFNITRPYEEGFPGTPFTDHLRRSPVPVRVIRYGNEALFPNTGGVFGIADAQGYNALTLDSYMDLMDAVEPGMTLKRRVTGLTRPEALGSPILDLLGVEEIVVLETSRGTVRTVARPNPGVLPRAFLVERSELVRDREEMLRNLANPGFDPSSVVYLYASDGEVPQGSPVRAEEGPPGTASITAYRANSLSVAVNARTDAWLVLGETYDPGWKARVDGERVKVRRADHAVRAVRVPAGRHTVEFRYQPSSFRLGAAVSLASLGLTALGLGLSRRRE